MRDKFHILMVLDERFPPDVRVENEVRSLLSAGFKVTVLSIAPYPEGKAGGSSGVMSHNGMTVVRVSTPKQVRNKLRGLAASIPALSLFVSHQIRRVCKRSRVDALHMHDLWLFGGGLRAARRLGIPVVGDLHENYVDALTQYAWSTRFPAKYVVNISRWRYLEAQWTRAVTKVICVNEAQKDRVIKLGVDPRRTVVTPNTIAIGEFDRYDVDATIIESVRSDFTIVYTGSFDLHRGLATLIRAMPIVLQQCRARLVLVGDGRIRSELESLANSLGIGDSVDFTGWQPQHSVKSYILGSDVCTLPTVKSAHTEASLPHKLFHYMYLKRPVLTTDCRMIRQIVESVRAGIVVPSESPKAMGEALLKLWREPNLRTKMGQNGHEAVLSRYNWDATVQDMVAMYQGLASG